MNDESLNGFATGLSQDTQEFSCAVLTASGSSATASPIMVNGKFAFNTLTITTNDSSLFQKRMNESGDTYCYYMLYE